MAEKWKIEIPKWHATNLNTLLKVHWAKRGRLKKADARVIKDHAVASGVPKAQRKRRVTLTYVIRQRSNAKFPDEDNVWKSLLDALKHAEVIVDDSPDWIEKDPVVYLKSKEKATVIELEDVA